MKPAHNSLLRDYFYQIHFEGRIAIQVDKLHKSAARWRSAVLVSVVSVLVSHIHLARVAHPPSVTKPKSRFCFEYTDFVKYSCTQYLSVHSGFDGLQNWLVSSQVDMVGIQQQQPEPPVVEQPVVAMSHHWSDHQAH